MAGSRCVQQWEAHAAVFNWVLVLIAEAGLIKGERIGVDASTMEANAALRNIVRRDNGEGYREMLERLARESGVETPTAEDLARLDRKRKGKKLFNTDWVSKSDPEAKIAKMKDGTLPSSNQSIHSARATRLTVLTSRTSNWISRSQASSNLSPCLSGLHPYPLGLEWAQTGYRGARHGCSRPRRSPIPAFATRVPATFPR